MPPIREITEFDLNHYAQAPQFVGCLVLSQKGEILLQKRGPDFESFPNKISTFGGKIEAGETSEEALVRELKEELGAEVNLNQAIKFGIILESVTAYQNPIHLYFWRDETGSITGCYEGEMKAFKNTEEILVCENLMDDVRWLIKKYRELKWGV